MRTTKAQISLCIRAVWSAPMACQTLHYSIFLYFYRILPHYYCIFWDLYLISGHCYSICFVSILYSMSCIQYPFIFIVQFSFILYIQSFALYNFGFVFNVWPFLFDLTSLLLYIFGFVFNICPFQLYIIHFYSIFYDLYSMSVYFCCIIFVYIIYSVICIVYFWICI